MHPGGPVAAVEHPRKCAVQNLSSLCRFLLESTKCHALHRTPFPTHGKDIFTAQAGCSHNPDDVGKVCVQGLTGSFQQRPQLAARQELALDLANSLQLEDMRRVVRQCVALMPNRLIQDVPEQNHDAFDGALYQCAAAGIFERHALRRQ